MALLEPSSIIASSLDNFYVFSNTSYQESPYVDFNVVGFGGQITIEIVDANNSDGTHYTLVGNESADSDFNTSTSTLSVAYSLLECLSNYPIFYNIHLINGGVRANIDTLAKYNISSSNALKIGVSGTYSSYNPRRLNKFNIEVRDGSNYFKLSKTSNQQQVPFNISSPFQYMVNKYPIDIILNGYQVTETSTKTLPITNNALKVMPTTLSKFESVDYSQYYFDPSSNDKAKFLTNKVEKSYNYGEYVGLSLLTNASSVSLRKKYYTNSGVYLTSRDGCSFIESVNGRVDFYDTFGILDVENQFNRQVGYIEVVGIHNNVEVTEKVTYTVNPLCSSNNEVFFVNKIGGIDSFNFLGEREEESKVKETTSTYSIPQRPFEREYSYESVHTKQTEKTVSLNTNKIDRDTAQYLEELQRSKCTFLYLPTTQQFKNIITDKFDIKVSSNDKVFELTYEYHDADNKISF